MVGVARIELATPAMSTQCSTTELHAREGGALASARRAGKRLWPAHSIPARKALHPEHAVDLEHEVAQVERLRQNARLRHRLAGLQRHRREAGNEHHAQIRHHFGGTLRQLDAVRSEERRVGKEWKARW